jgi:hypothetical protein
VRSGRAFRVLGLTLVAILAAAVAGVVWIKSSPRRTPAGQPALARIDAPSLAALRDAFNAAHGRTRIVVLLSPT